MKAAEARSLESDELEGRLKTSRRELYELRFKIAVGQLDDHRQIRKVRQDIARLLTFKRQRELGIFSEPTGSIESQQLEAEQQSVTAEKASAKPPAKARVKSRPAKAPARAAGSKAKSGSRSLLKPAKSSVKSSVKARVRAKSSAKPTGAVARPAAAPAAKPAKLAKPAKPARGKKAGASNEDNK